MRYCFGTDISRQQLLSSSSKCQLLSQIELAVVHVSMFVAICWHRNVKWNVALILWPLVVPVVEGGSNMRIVLVISMRVSGASGKITNNLSQSWVLICSNISVFSNIQRRVPACKQQGVDVA